MQAALHITTEVKQGGKIEITDTQLPVGQSVEVIVLLPSATGVARRSIVEILAEAPGHLAFQTAEEIDQYLREERDSWDR